MKVEADGTNSAVEVHLQLSSATAARANMDAPFSFQDMNIMMFAKVNYDTLQARDCGPTIACERGRYEIDPIVEGTQPLPTPFPRPLDSAELCRCR